MKTLEAHYAQAEPPRTGAEQQSARAYGAAGNAYQANNRHFNLMNRSEMNQALPISIEVIDVPSLRGRQHNSLRCVCD